MHRFPMVVCGLMSAVAVAFSVERSPPVTTELVVTAYSLEGGTTKDFLLMDESHAVCQDEQGNTRWTARVVKETDSALVGYHWGAPSAMRFTQERDAILVSFANGTQSRFARILTPAPELGWKTYALPVAKVNPQVRTAIADKLRQLVAEQERLGAAYNAAIQIATKSPTFDGKVDSIPECVALRAFQTDARAWLRQTLQTTGWITADYGLRVAADLSALVPVSMYDLRLLSTFRAGITAELARGGCQDRDAVAIIDGYAIAMGEPLPYGSQVQMRLAEKVDGQPDVYEELIAVPADVSVVEAARRRAGLPILSQASWTAKAKIVRMGADGRQLGEIPLTRPGPVKVDPVAIDLALRDPRAELQDLAQRDPEFATALAEAEKGQIEKLAAWIKGASVGDRMLFGISIQNMPRQINPADPQQASFNQRHLYEAFLEGAPVKKEEAPRIAMSRDLATALVGRSVAPTAAELTQAASLATTLEQGLQRRDLKANPQIAHGMADALACIYFRQGRMAEAAATWKKAIGWAGDAAPESYRRRLQAAESGAKPEALPR